MPSLIYSKIFALNKNDVELYTYRFKFKDIALSDNLQIKNEESVILDIQKPKKYLVIMHNDNYSTWEFVIETLKRVFYKKEEEAEIITASIHHKGFGVCGIYPHEIAIMKIEQVHTLAKANGYPLKCTLEEDA